MPKRGFATFAVTSVVVAATLTGCSGSHPHTVAGLIASLPKTATDKPAGPFVINRLPAGHVIDNVVRGTAPALAASRWCVRKLCASPAFFDWRELAWSGVGTGPRDAWPKGTYAIVLDAPAPRVSDNRKNVLPAGSAFDIAMLPGSRADLALGASYNAMRTSNGGEEGPAQDVWFEQRLVHVGAQDAVLTESYGSDENFPRDTKTLYFEGPHGELGVVRATSNIFYGSDIWLRVKGRAARLAASHREAQRQQVGDSELVAVATSVRAATTSEFAAAATRVAADRVCTLGLHASSSDEHVIASGTITLPDNQPGRPAVTHQAWKLLQGHDATGNAACPRDDTTCPHQLGPCLAWQANWGDWQRTPAHAVYLAFSSPRGPMLFALAPNVRSLRITTRTNAGKETPATVVATAAGINGVRWALSPVRADRVTALDAAGQTLETVRADLSGP